MQFSILAEYFQRLEETASRLALIDILAELFKEVDKEEVGMVSYLLQGRVAPFYEATEIGMSEKLVAQSMARAYSIDKEEILKEFGRVGDLGVVAQRHSELVSESEKRSRNKQSLRSGDLEFGMTVSVVFNTLTEIA